MRHSQSLAHAVRSLAETTTTKNSTCPLLLCVHYARVRAHLLDYCPGSLAQINIVMRDGRSFRTRCRLYCSQLLAYIARTNNTHTDKRLLLQNSLRKIYFKFLGTETGGTERNARRTGALFSALTALFFVQSFLFVVVLLVPFLCLHILYPLGVCRTRNPFQHNNHHHHHQQPQGNRNMYYMFVSLN